MINEYDIESLAENGLRRGRTTGTCATAAVKAALTFLLHDEKIETVPVTLPDGEHYLPVPIQSVYCLEDGSVRADVVKDAGDDPDQTHKAVIFACVRPNNTSKDRFLAGSGVGIVTQPGIRVPLMEPAINPVPRQMMLAAIEEILEGAANPGFDLTIGCVNGEEIAKKTFNPRLGIVGGISILGTTGIVEPMSLSAYRASIEVYIRVALGEQPDEIVYMPGNIGTSFARNVLKLEKKQIVHISNFMGFSLECANLILTEECFRLKTLWVLGHPGKIAKILERVWDTHSKKSGMAMNAVAEVALSIGFSPELALSISKANTVEAVMELIENKNDATKLWSEIEKRTGRIMHELVPNADNIQVRLFAMNGTPLGQSA